MASIYRDIHVAADAESAWDALRDFGKVHERLARGFVTGTVTVTSTGTGTGADGDARVVTFANGATAREVLIAADGERRRLVYSVVESSFPLTHHQASVEVVPAADGATLRWITDVLPDAAAAPIGQMMEAGAVAIAATLAA